MFLDTVKKIASNPTVGQLSMVAAKTLIVCGIVVGTSMIASRKMMADSMKKVEKMMDKADKM